MEYSHVQTPPTIPASDSTPGAPPSKQRTAPSGASTCVATVATQDLSGDKLILAAPRTAFNENNVPALGDIPLLAKIGQGGMGAVYYGVHPRLNKEVAIKVLPFDLAERSPAMIERFYREAQLAARVQSPHLVGVLDVNKESGLFYLVMEFVDGISAGKYLRTIVDAGSQGLRESEALDLCTAACRGLAAAHEKGIIHRDVKPDNILIPRDERTQELRLRNAKLADLGLARNDTFDSGEMTLSGACMGTPGFLSPEQAGDARSCGKPADVFCMGATLYALLTGDAPFTGSALVKVLNATISEPHVPIREKRPEISAATAELLDRCLAKDPENRYADADALLAALVVCRAGLSATGVTAVTVKTVADTPSPVRSRSAMKSSGAGVGLRETLRAAPAPALKAANTPFTRAKKVLLFSALALSLMLCVFGVMQFHGPMEMKRSVPGNDALAKADVLDRKTSPSVTFQASPDLDKPSGNGSVGGASDARRDDAQPAAAGAQKKSDETKREETAKVTLLEQQRDAVQAAEFRRREERKMEAQKFSSVRPHSTIQPIIPPPQQPMAMPKTFAIQVMPGGIADHAAVEAQRKAMQRENDKLRNAAISEAKKSLESYRNNLTSKRDVEHWLGLTLTRKPDDAEAKAIFKTLADLNTLSLDCGNGAVLELVRIEPGTFLMGSPPDEKDRAANEKQHPVTISKAFYMGKFTVTQNQYEAVMGRNPSQFKGPKNPVDSVSWNDAAAFCQKLNEQSGAKLPAGTVVQLPTEAQWEYACRAGTQTRFHSGDKDADLDAVAWHKLNSEARTHPVGEKQPNALGLYDMHGNASQWCQDGMTNGFETLSAADPISLARAADGYVLRGGSFKDEAGKCRSASRNKNAPDARENQIGFRIVVSVPPEKAPSSESRGV